MNNLLDIGTHTMSSIHNLNFWMVIALGEFVIFLILGAIYIGKKKRFKTTESKTDIKEEIDFSNIVASAFHSDELYDEMKKKCHPDRFPNDKKKNEIANDIFQELSKNRNDYKKLNELKIRAINELGITFK